MTTRPRRPARRCSLLCTGVESVERGRLVTRCEVCHALLDAEPLPPEREEQLRAETRVGCLLALAILAAAGVALLLVRWWIVWAK